MPEAQWTHAIESITGGILFVANLATRPYAGPTCSRCPGTEGPADAKLKTKLQLKKKYFDKYFQYQPLSAYLIEQNHQKDIGC